MNRNEFMMQKLNDTFKYLNDYKFNMEKYHENSGKVLEKIQKIEYNIENISLQSMNNEEIGIEEFRNNLKPLEFQLRKEISRLNKVIELSEEYLRCLDQIVRRSEYLVTDNKKVRKCTKEEKCRKQRKFKLSTSTKETLDFIAESSSKTKVIEKVLERGLKEDLIDIKKYKDTGERKEEVVVWVDNTLNDILLIRCSKLGIRKSVFVELALREVYREYFKE